MRSPGRLRLTISGRRDRLRQAELVVLAIEIGLVDGEAVDEQLGLAGLAQQQAEIGGETVGVGGGDALGHAPVDIVALGFAEQHSRAAVQELAKPDEVPRSQIFRACLHRHGLSSSRCWAILDSGTTSSAPPARTSSPGMPQTTALSSASAMVSAASGTQFRHGACAVIAHAGHQDADQLFGGTCSMALSTMRSTLGCQRRAGSAGAAMTTSLPDRRPTMRSASPLPT